MLVGNKSDLASMREVPIEKGKKFAEKYNMSFMEVSALDNVNINDAFQEVMHHIFEKSIRPNIIKDGEKDSFFVGTTNVITIEPPDESSKDNCPC